MSHCQMSGINVTTGQSFCFFVFWWFKPHNTKQVVLMMANWLVLLFTNMSKNETMRYFVSRKTQIALSYKKGKL